MTVFLAATNESGQFGPGIAALSFGNAQSVSSGTVVFSNANNVTFGLTQGTVTASIPPIATTDGLISAINVAAANQTNNVTGVVFSNSYNVTFGLNNGTLTASASIPTSPPAAAAISASNGSFSYNTLSLGTVGDVQFYTTNGSIAAVLNNPVNQYYTQLTSNFAASAYPGYVAVPTDVGLLGNVDGDTPNPVWPLPLTEGQQYGPLTGSISPAASDRYWMGFGMQEMSAVVIGGTTYVYGTTSGQIAWATCTGDPLVTANWSQPTAMFGNGVGGYADQVAHSYVLQVGTTLYLYFIDLSTQNIGVATATTSAPTTFTYVGIVYTGVVGGGSANGNCCVVYYNFTYYMFQEALHVSSFPVEGNTGPWQIFCLTSSSPTGTFTLGVLQTSLRPSFNGGMSGAWVQIFTSAAGVPTASMWYHGTTWGRQFPNDIYCATIPATSLGSDVWTIRNADPVPIIFTAAPSGTSATLKNQKWLRPSGIYTVVLSTGQSLTMTMTYNSSAVTYSTAITGSPTAVASCPGYYTTNPVVLKRTHPYEFDQVADPFLFQSSNGWWYVIYEGSNNRVPWFESMITPLLPTPNQNDYPYAHPIMEARYPEPLPYWNPYNPTFIENVPLPMASGMANAAVNVAKTTGTWACVYTSGAPGSVIRTNTSNANGDAIYFDIPGGLPPGQYELSINLQTSANGALISGMVYDGAQTSVTPFTIQTYSALTAYANFTVTTIHILGLENFMWRMRFVAGAGTGGGYTIGDCGWTLQQIGP